MNACASSRLRPASARYAALAVLMLAASAAGQQRADVLRVAGRRPHDIVVARGESWDRTLPLDTAMGRMAAGVYARYEKEAVGRLLRCATRDPLPPTEPDTTRRIAVLHLSLRDGEQVSRVEVLRLADGSLGARALESPGSGVRLDAKRLETLAADWPAYRGALEASPDDPPGASAVMPQPYVPGSITMTARTLKARLYRGLPVRIVDADRDLARETLHARLPAGYDPRRPSGLLVWSSPTPDGRIPAALGEGLDELGIVCVAADNAGNERDVPDKFQLVFDAIASARERYHIDERRVYIAGMSGGGKVASILGLCFPEVFAGAVAIVGVGTHSRLDESWGRYRPAYFVRPREPVLAQARQRRLALMSGPPDFNYKEMVERATLLEADGFPNVKFFDYPDMAHRMPTSARFAEALRWLDEPYRRTRDEQEALAASLLDTYLERRDDAAPRTGDDRAALRAVVESGPWSDAAWRALELSRRPETGSIAP
jgi:predicted esterase